MGDPTGISGAVVAKLLDEVIMQTKNTINYRRYCENLHNVLENIQPLVRATTASPPRDYYTDANGRVVAGPSAVKKWLEDLKIVLEDARALVLQCQSTSSYNIFYRNKMARKVLSITRGIESVSMTQAPLAALNIMEEIVQVAFANNQLLSKITAQLEVNVNAMAVGETTKAVLQIEGMKPAQAFLEIRSRTDILAASAHTDSGQTSSFQQSDHEDEESSNSFRPVPEKTFGMDVPLENLQNLLLRETSGMKWVGVYGKGGIGKTLLAEQACNSEAVQDRFQKNTFWLTVGKSPSIERLLKRLCDMLRISNENFESSEAKTKIFNVLRGKRALLVLDDVWEDDGVDILGSLDVTGGWESGSKILVTTRNIEVLERKHAQEESTITIEPLSEKDSWELFCEFSFGGIGNIPTKLEKVGRAVANECKGLPLALKVIAGAQAGQRAPEQWQRSLKKLKDAEILDVRHQEQLYNRLQLSYDSLELLEPDHRHRLQKCFIYFAGFPEDSDVDMDKLVSLWAGEKLIEAADDMEDDIDPSVDGNYLLGVLIGRSLIDLQKPDWSHSVNSLKLRCRVHDVLRDLARHLIRQRRAPMDCLFTAGEGLKKFPDDWLTPTRPRFPELLGPKTSGLKNDATHLSLNDNLLESLPTKLKAPKLEVLLLAQNGAKNLVISPGFLESFSSLKVLDLEHSMMDSLPESLGKLKNLVYLNLSFTGLRKLPRGLRKLKKLEHLSLQNCSNIEPWPFDVSSLKSLSFLNTRGCGEIWKLGSRGTYHISEYDSLESLCSLTALRNLSISGSRQILPSTISSLVNLRHLSVFFANLTRLPPELSGPKLSKLQYLSLDNCLALVELPSWTACLSQLVTLNLVFCRRVTSLPDLHKLKELQKLDLSFCTGLQQLPPGFAAGTAFPNLKELYMANCEGLQEFPFIEEGAFPQLMVLELTGCNFQTLPRSMSLLPKLQKLKLNLCRRLKSLDDCFRLQANDSRGSTSQQRHIVPFFRNLRELGLKGVPLDNLPQDVAACPTLKMVDLRETHVMIPENLRSLQAEGKLTILISSV